MRLWVTRPEPDARAQAQALERRGHETMIEPLIAIRFRDQEPLPASPLQALLATSRNALRALARRDDITRLRATPLFAIGDATAALAKELDFARIIEAGGTGAALIEHVSAECRPEAGPLLHLAGDHLAIDLKAALGELGFDVMQATVYESVGRQQLSDQTQAAIHARGLEGVILMSPRSAHIYQTLIERHRLTEEAQEMWHFCLSQAVSRALGPLKPAHLAVAAAPRQGELLALIGEATAH